MKKKMIGILIIVIMITTIFPSIGASLNNNIQNKTYNDLEETTVYES